MKSVMGQTVVITGAGNGLGRELAIEFAKRGANVVVWDIDEVAIEETIRMVSVVAPEVKVKGYVCDVSVEELVFEVADRLKRDVGSVDILVNNAAIFGMKDLVDLSCDHISHLININVLGNFWTIKAFLPDMIKSNLGHIVTVSSMAGHTGIGQMSHYNASKFALVGLHQSLDMEMWQAGLDGIKTTLVAPSFINTKMINGMFTTSGYEASDVAKRVISAVLSDTNFVAIPNGLHHVVMWSKMILPVKAFYYLAELFGFYELTKSFAARIHQD